MTDRKTFLDGHFKAAEAEISARGEPDCFVVFKACKLHGPEGVPVAIYGTRGGLYEKFATLRFDGWEPMIGMWWFDDK